ncbi:MAG: SRPBCC family protein [Phycisphaerae bacterium]
MAVSEFTHEHQPRIATIPVDKIRRATPAGRPTHAGKRINVGTGGRQASVVGGVALLVGGLARGGLGGILAAATGSALAWRGVTGHCPMSEAVGRDSAAGHAADPHTLYEKGVSIREAVTILKGADELYDFWRKLENIASIMRNVESVEESADGISHWVIRGPFGVHVEFDAEVIADEEGRRISWRSVHGTDVDHAGTVRFLPAGLVGDKGRGTEVRVEIEYVPPAGRFSAKVLRLLGQDPAGDVRQDLRDFKALMEAGEVPSIEGQPRGSCAYSACA